MAKKMQTGGVSQVIPRPQAVEDIPVFNAPTYDLMSLPPRDILAIANKMQVNKATKEASDLAEQRYQDSLEKAYMDYKTKLFGPVHSSAQKQKLESLQQRHGISGEGVQGLLQNQVLLKDEIRKLQSALSDQDYINTAGEVFRGNKFRDYAMEKFSKDEFVEWEENAWEPYVRGEADLETANPTRFKSAKALRQVNFRTAESTLMNDFDTVNLEDQGEVSDMAQRLAMSYYETNPEAAVAQNLLQVNDDGTYQLTKPALDNFMTAVRVRQRDKQREAALSIDKYQTQRAIADAYADGNRVGRSGSGSSKTPEDIEKTYKLLETVHGLTIPRDRPDLKILVEGYASAGAQAERDEILSKIKELAGSAVPKIPVSLNTSEADLIRNGFVPPVQGPLAPPRPTLRDLMKQNGL